MNQFVAILRRVASMMAALAVFSSFSVPAARAQADAPPADSAATASSATGKKAKKVRAIKAPKVAKVAKPKAPKAPPAAVVAPAPKPPAAKSAKTPKVKTPEKSLAEQKKDDGVYAKNSNWLAFKLGYAKRSGKLSGDGFVGYGVAFQHMISRKYAFGAGVGHDVVGHFASQIDEAVPFTAEFARFYNWKGAMRPYIGLGGGYYFRKSYRTGSEYTTTTTGGPHVTIGFTSPLDDRHVIGFETRIARINGRPGIVNPTFGPGETSETLWTAKVSWALVY